MCSSTQRVLNEHLASLNIKRAIVVPNAQIAHLARLAFGAATYRVFYGDLRARRTIPARLPSPFTSADWERAGIEERRLRERRHVRRRRRRTTGERPGGGLRARLGSRPARRGADAVPWRARR
jgi:hypothetical protein